MCRAQARRQNRQIRVHGDNFPCLHGAAKSIGKRLIARLERPGQNFSHRDRGYYNFYRSRRLSLKQRKKSSGQNAMIFEKIYERSAVHGNAIARLQPIGSVQSHSRRNASMYRATLP